MKIGRRPVFFAAVAVLCLLLTPVTPGEFRWVDYAMGGLAVFWAVVLGLEDLATARDAERRRRRDS
jgi:hypothetical protein